MTDLRVNHNCEIAEVSFGVTGHGNMSKLRELADLEEAFEKNRIKAERFSEEDDATRWEL